MAADKDAPLNTNNAIQDNVLIKKATTDTIIRTLHYIYMQ
jgi:hypothetical protein